MKGARKVMVASEVNLVPLDLVGCLEIAGQRVNAERED